MESVPETKSYFLKCKDSQFVALQSCMVQQVEATVVLLRKVNVAHHGQDLDDAPEVLSNGIVQRRVPI